jgi:hippurate hydrolase
MAANDEWTIRIQGKGGHASAPHDGVDPIVCGALFVSAVQHIVARNVAPQEAAVVTVTCFQAGTPPADNIIPDSAILVGTVRAGTTERRDALAQRVQTVLQGICAATGATATFEYRPCYPATVNHAAEAELARAALRIEVGPDAIQDQGMPLMAAEDFGAFLREKPGAFILLGAGRPGQPIEGCHSPRFDFNDDLIPIVAKLWARLAGIPVQPR